MKKKKLFSLLLLVVLSVVLITGCGSNGLFDSTDTYSLTTVVENEEGEEKGGTISVEPEKDNYEKNDTVTITAKPNDFFSFVEWTGDVSSEEKSVEVVMDSDKNVIANFQRDTTVAVQYFANEVRGSISREILEVAGTYQSDRMLPAGSKIKLTATANDGFEFSHWEKGEENREVIGEEAEITVTVAEEVENYFARFKCTKEMVDSEDSDIGEVEVTNAHDLYSLEKGHIVLTATPKPSGVFTGWTQLPDEDYIVSHSAPTVEESKSIVLRGFGEVDPMADFEKAEGAFKVVNSWGANWGPYQNGTMHMTYAAAANANAMAYVQEKEESNYEPQAIATFDLSGSTSWRNYVNLEVFVTDSEGNEIANKYFYPYTFLKGGGHYFPDNKMVMDITELLVEAKNNSITDAYVYFAVYNNEAYGTVNVESFDVEIYGNGYSLDPSNATTTAHGIVPSEEIIDVKPTPEIASAVSISLEDIDKNAYTLSSSDNLERHSREITTHDVEKIMNNYKEVDNSSRTGLIPMNKQQWDTVMKNDTIKMLGNLPEPSDDKIDLTETQYFPPIGNQAAEGSCVAWGVTYYARTFNEAIENNWDFTGESYETADKSKLMSPEFTYQLINGGEDGGSIYVDALQVNKHMGVASLATMPYDDGNATAWGSENAWREAVKYRNPGPREDVGNGYFIMIDDVEDINTVKNLIANDYLVTISIDANLYGPPLWTVDNYVNPGPNHANTLAGFDDDFTL